MVVRADRYTEYGKNAVPDELVAVTPDVGEQDGGFVKVSSQVDRAVQDRLGNLAGQVLAEQPLDPVAFLQSPQHGVEPQGQFAQLVVGQHGGEGVQTPWPTRFIACHKSGTWN